MTELIVPEPYSELLDAAMDLDRAMLEKHPEGFARPYYDGEFWPMFPSNMDKVNAVIVRPLTDPDDCAVIDGARSRIPVWLPEFETVKREDQPPYQYYINSIFWKARAYTAKERAGQRCQVCNKSQDAVQLDAHHRTYERLGNEQPDDITVLCHNCHAKFHGKEAHA